MASIRRVHEQVSGLLQSDEATAQVGDMLASDAFAATALNADELVDGVLGGLLLYVGSRQNVMFGMSLLFVYALGVGALILLGFFPGPDLFRFHPEIAGGIFIAYLMGNVMLLVLGIVLAPLFLHGGVIPWLFALLPGQPGWFGPVQGPQFLAAALASALGAVTLLAYVFRRAHRWEQLIDDDVFRGLSRWTGLFALLFLWLQLQKVVTGLAMPPESVGAAVAATVRLPAYWVAMLLLAVTLVHAGIQMLSPRRFSVTRTAVVAVLPLVAILIEKALFVIEGLMYPVFRLDAGVPGTYTPTWVEMSSLVGALSIVVLVFLAAAKAIPLTDLDDEAVWR